MEVYVKNKDELDGIISSIKKEFDELVILNSSRSGILTRDDSLVEISYDDRERKLLIKDPFFTKGRALPDEHKKRLVSDYFDSLIRLIKTYPDARQEGIITGYIVNKGKANEEIFEIVVLYNPDRFAFREYLNNTDLASIKAFRNEIIGNQQLIVFVDKVEVEDNPFKPKVGYEEKRRTFLVPAIFNKSGKKIILKFAVQYRIKGRKEYFDSISREDTELPWTDFLELRSLKECLQKLKQKYKSRGLTLLCQEDSFDGSMEGNNALD